MTCLCIARVPSPIEFFLAPAILGKIANSTDMAANGSASSANGDASQVLDLLALQESENSRASLVRKHDTLKAQMEQLKQERQEQAKKKKALTAAIKNAKRKRSRIIHKAASLSKEDIVQILCHKSEVEDRKFKKLRGSSDGTVSVDEDAPASESK